MNNVLEALQGDFKLFLQALWSQLVYLSLQKHSMQSQNIFSLDPYVFKFKLSVELESPGLLEPLFCGRFSITLKKRSIISASKDGPTTCLFFFKN